MIKIIDYRAGNAPSVLHGIKKLAYSADLISVPSELKDATHIILPGVGSAGATMQSLREMGFIDALRKSVLYERIPFFGICVGLQVLFQHSCEDDTTCLGWLEGDVKKFDTNKVRVPQMGWNEVEFIKDRPHNINRDYFYFVNSYYAQPKNKEDIWATADYNGQFTAAIRKDNIYATQFHAEKSGQAGLEILKYFLTEVK